MTSNPAAVDRWLATLERRQLESLTFPEVRRALQALSSLYVERRSGIARGAALDGRGKRAAFALFYGPLHFLFVREAVRALGAVEPPPGRLLDLGCGTGTAGAAWAMEAPGRTAIEAIDRNPWAVAETRLTYRDLGLAGAARKGDVDRLDLVSSGAGGVLCAFTANELGEASRARLLAGLLAAAGNGSAVLVAEPLARGIAPWWEDWARAFVGLGGRADEWRFQLELPEIVRRLDRASGLDHRTLGGRTLWIARGQAAIRDRGAHSGR